MRGMVVGEGGRSSGVLLYQERDGEEDRKPGGKTCVKLTMCGGLSGQYKVEE